MGWVGWPAVPHVTNIQDPEWLYQLWHAFRLRWRIAFNACANWPISHWEYTYGTISSIAIVGDEIHLTSNDVVVVDALGVKRFVGWGGGDFNGETPPPDVATAYDIVANVDAKYPHDVVQGHIADTTQTWSGGVPGPATFIIPHDGRWTLNHAIGFFAGKKLGVIKRDGRNWASRWPAFGKPNGAEHDYGFASASTPTSISDDTKTWAQDQFNGKQVACSVDGKITRIDITATIAAEKKITFAAQTAAPDLAAGYWIIDPPSSPRGFWRWEDRVQFHKFTDPDTGEKSLVEEDKPYPHIFKWYGGAKVATWSHWRNAELADMRVNKLVPYEGIAIEELPLNRGAVLEFCSTDPATKIYRTDAYVDINDVCGSADTLPNPDLWMVLGSILDGIIEMCGEWAFKFDPIDGDTVGRVTPLQMPFLMQAAGEHYREVDITSYASGTATIAPAISMPDGRSEYPCWVAVLDPHGGYQIDGTFLAVASASGGGIRSVNLAPHAGKRAAITFGPRRVVDRLVCRLRPIWVFRPNTRPDTGAAIDPPEAEEDKTGRWQKIDASVNGAEFTEGGELREVGRPLLDNVRYRYIGGGEGAGGNIGDPTTFDAVGDGTPTDPDPDVDTVYKDAGDAVESVPQTLSGTVGRCGKYWIEDLAAELETSTTPRIVHSGTFDGGDTTHGSDSSKVSDAFFDPGVFNANEERLKDQILYVEMDPGQPGVYEPALIIAQPFDHYTTFTVSEAMSATLSGKNWKIEEPGGLTGADGPGVMHACASMTLILSRADGSESHEFTVKGNGRKVFIFPSDAAYVPQTGDSWRVKFWRPGAVLKKQGSTWVDPGVAGHTVYQLDADTYELNGRHCKQDHVEPVKCNFLNMLYRCMNAMVETFEAASFNNHGETNFGDASGGDADVATAKSECNSDWPHLSSDGGFPHTLAQVVEQLEAPAFVANEEASYSWLQASPFLCSRFGINSRLSDFWLYAGIQSNDPDAGELISEPVVPPRRFVYEFDNSMGLTYRRWRKIGTVSDGAATQELLVGNRAGANLPAEPVLPTGGDGTTWDIDFGIDTGPPYADLYLRGCCVLSVAVVTDWTSSLDGYV
jgi:hypothetical protein